MIHHTVRIALLTAICLFVATTASAAIVAEYSGSAADPNPTTQGWIDTSGGAADAGPPANWRIVTTGGSGIVKIDGGTAIAAANDPSGWTYTQTSKLTVADGMSRAMWRLKDLTNRWEIHMRSDGSDDGLYYYDNTSTAIQIGTVDPTDGFHTYQVELDPVGGVGNSANVVSFYVDGTLEHTTTRAGMQGSGSAAGQFFFGAGTGAASDQQYSFVRFETGQTVPEPTAIVLLGMGGLLLAVARRRRR